MSDQNVGWSNILYYIVGSRFQDYIGVRDLLRFENVPVLKNSWGFFRVSSLIKN
jgi:hypothetical protein